MLRTILNAVIFIALAVPAFGQSSFLIELGTNRTNFMYMDADSVQDTTYNPRYNQSFAAGYQFEWPTGYTLGGKLGLRDAGATYVFNDYNYSWNLKYADFRLSTGYTHHFGKLGTHFFTQGYIAYMIQGNQRTHNDDIDLIARGGLERLDYGVFFTPGVSYDFLENVSGYFDLNYMWGIANIEQDEQVTQNRLMGISIGVSIDLLK